MMKETLLPTKVLNLLGLPDNQPKTTVLSVHAKTESTGTQVFVLHGRAAW